MRRELRSILGGALVSWGLAGVGPVMAGDLSTQTTGFCDWTYAGTVRAADVAKFEAARENPSGTTLCLDSAGGDTVAGRALMTQVRERQIRTRVLPGHRCEGACALIFLGGATVDGAGLVRFPHREIWPGARLGFSAGPEETALDLAERLFSLKVSEEQGHRLIEDHLFQQILRHRGNSNYRIDTVGDAYLSNIPVMGLAPPDLIGPAQITHICDAVYLRHRLHDGTAGQLDKDFLSTAHSAANLEHNRIAPIEAAVIAGGDGQSLTGYAGPYWAGSKYWRRECYVTIRPGDIAAYGGDNAALGITGIAVEFRDHGGAARDITAFDPEGWMASTRLVGAYDVPPVLLYPLYARLDDLPLSPGAKAAQAAGGPPLPAPAPGFARFEGMDLAGGDLGRQGAADGAACIAACQATPGCTAATHDRWNRMCFLKDLDSTAAQLSRQPKSDVYVAGTGIDRLQEAPTSPVILRRAGKGFLDQPSFYFQASDFDDCAAQCLENGTCNAFNFLPESGACQVINRPGEYFDRAGVEAGLKMQPL